MILDGGCNRFGIREGLIWGIPFALHMEDIFRSTVMGCSLLCEFACENRGLQSYYEREIENIGIMNVG